MRTVLSSLWVAILPIVLAASPAGAASPDATELIAEATRIAGQGDVEQAVAKLRQAVELETTNAGLRFQVARMLAALGDLETAGSVFAALIEEDPGNSAARLGEASVLLFQGRYLEARAQLEEGLRALPKDGQLAHMLARVLATAPADEARDGETALALALKVWEVRKIWETGETVAMAMAEAGRYEDAVEFQRGLIEQAEAAGEEERLEGLRLRLLNYLSHEAWRAESAAEIANAAMPDPHPPAPDGDAGQSEM